MQGDIFSFVLLQNIAKYCENYLKSLVGSKKLNFFFHVCMSLALGSHKPNFFFHVCLGLAQLCSSLFKNHDGDDKTDMYSQIIVYLETIVTLFTKIPSSLVLVSAWWGWQFSFELSALFRPYGSTPLRLSFETKYQFVSSPSWSSKVLWLKCTSYPSFV